MNAVLTKIESNSHFILFKDGIFFNFYYQYFFIKDGKIDGISESL